jgi:hypothetical protein
MNKSVIEGDWTDDVVYSNLAYLAPALFAPEPLGAALVGMAGMLLCLGSAAYHATYERWARRLDVTGMLTFAPAVVATIAAQWSPWAYAGIPLASAFYWQYALQINSVVHVPAWVLLGVLFLAAQMGGVWALVPAGLFVAGGAVRLWIEPNSDSWWHSIWHLLGAGAALAALVLL